MATRFSSTCRSAYSPTLFKYPPLASNPEQASKLYWDWVKGIPGGHGFGPICGGEISQQVWPAFAHTGALLGAAAPAGRLLQLGAGDPGGRAGRLRARRAPPRLRVSRLGGAGLPGGARVAVGVQL